MSELLTFDVRVMVTARVAGYTEIEATTLEEACEIVQHLDLDSIPYSVDEDFYIDGDEVAFVREEEDLESEVEVDCRAKHEPFAWDAVNLVKKLAALDVFKNEDRTTAIAMIEEAKTLLKNGDSEGTK